MALIGTLREKAGLWVVVFVFLAIAAFVLQDVLGNNSVLLNDDSVGEIGGRTISREEFVQAIAERESSYFMRTGQTPTERQMPTMRQTAWEMLIVRHAIESQYEKIGATVTIEEMEDMLYGKNINPEIRQGFTDPQTGMFDVQRVKEYLRSLQTEPETDNEQVLADWRQRRGSWEVLQGELKSGRARIKYENLMIKSTYITTAEAEQDYHIQTDVAEVKFLFVPFYSLSDSAIKVTDADYQAYYDKNKAKFKSEFTRDLKFVQFPVTASAADSLEIKSELDKLVEEFKNSTDDSLFAVNDTHNAAIPYTKYNTSSLPTYISKDDLVVGTVKGPFRNGSGYSLLKVVKTAKEKLDSAKASHILFRWNSDSEADKAVAKAEATKVLKEIKDGANFEDKARELGTDGSAANGGDLGWFYTGNDPNYQHMVKPFEKAVFDASKPGLLNELVETEFGYHIVKVTSSKKTKEVTTYTIAEIQHEVNPSDASITDALRKAEAFSTELSGVDNFVKRAEQEGITVYDGKNLGVDERRLNTLPDAREIIRWLFNEGKQGKVSTVFDLQEVYVVAVMTGETEEGFRSLSQVKEEITPAVTNEVKGKAIADKLNGLTGSLEEIAAAYGKDATVNSLSDLKLSTSTLPAAGFDPKAIGEAFSPESGKRTKAFTGERGVLLVEVQTKTIAPAMGDYTAYKNQLMEATTGRNSGNIGNAIKEQSDIVDKRYKFF